MIEFLAYLGPYGQEIMSIVSKKYTVLENAPICRKHDIFGWADSVKRQFVVCTDRIARNVPDHKREYIQETVFHEAVHVSQHCKSRNNHFVPLGIQNVTLSAIKVKSLRESVRLSGMQVYGIEKEAHYLETRPNDVLFYLRKYCL
jgi:hypothetical protein